MTPILHLLIEERLREAVLAQLPDTDPAGILVRPCPDPRFGDYQSVALIALAKERKLNPRLLAEKVVAGLNVAEWCDRVEVAGAGFINFGIRREALTAPLRSAARGEHLFFTRTIDPRTIVVDFSSPNVARRMHVGHIRSTILGDCLARTLTVLGHRVIRDNHVGDWGTQFGKLILGWKTRLDKVALAIDPLAEMERLYKAVNDACEHEPATLEAARQELVKLQNGDAENLKLWQQMIAQSQMEFEAIYQALGVHFDHTLGESFYNPHLKAVVLELVKIGLAKESEGAKVVFFDDVPQLKAHPALIEKSDGAANYTTTDLATLEYRIENWRPDEIIYVTDGRQQLHFQQLFQIFRRWRPHSKVKLDHVWFGTILGSDGKPFKTRSGENIKLADLLGEARDRAFRVVSEKSPGISVERREEIARIVGLGAIKYSDLLANRQSDYVFDWDKMLALNGNTAPYLLYAYTRIRGILRKADAEGGDLACGGSTDFLLTAPEELSLAKHLMRFGLALEATAEERRPNYLCNYLYELAACFARFYEICPVLKAPAAQRSARLSLCELTGRVTKQGLAALGIETTEEM